MVNSKSTWTVETFWFEYAFHPCESSERLSLIVPGLKLTYHESRSNMWRKYIFVSSLQFWDFVRPKNKLKRKLAILSEWLKLSWGFETTPSHWNGLKQSVSHYSLFFSNSSLSGFFCRPCYGTKDRCEWRVAVVINPTSFRVGGTRSLSLAVHLGEGSADFKSPTAL